MADVSLEADDFQTPGEVPGDASLLYGSVIKGFVRNIRKMREAKAPDDHELAVKIPDQLSGVADTVSLDGLTLSRNQEEQGFLATYEKSVKNKRGEYRTKEVTVALTVTAAVVVAGSLYWRHKKKLI